jgi:hypothetical protein
MQTVYTLAVLPEKDVLTGEPYNPKTGIAVRAFSSRKDLEGWILRNVFRSPEGSYVIDGPDGHEAFVEFYSNVFNLPHKRGAITITLPHNTFEVTVGMEPSQNWTFDIPYTPTHLVRSRK